MSLPSIERSVVRSYLASIVGVSLAIVVVSAVMTTLVVVERDDAEARALALTLGAELQDHRDEPREALDTLVQHELEEQQWFQREIEVWQGENRIGGAPETGRLSQWVRQRGCALGNVAGTLSRVCVASGDPGTAVVVASPMRPLLAAELPILGAIALAALLSATAFTVVGRRVVRRSLRPLQAFEQSVASRPALDGGSVRSEWGAVEIDQLARTFNALLARIDAAVEREQRFVSNAAHELRTPLTRLRGQIDLVLHEGSVSAESSRRLSLAARSCEELSRSVDALLALSHDEAASNEAVDLGELASEVIGVLEDEDARRIRVVVAQALVRGDPTLLALATRNLVDNALKYSSGAVEVRVAGDPAHCSLTVLDEGPGIPEAELMAVRGPFVRGRQDANLVRGAGLGLALVEHVSTLHEGELSLQNASPRGLRAAMILPSWRPT
ncbi:MAG: ATP-binding protein [Polyangiales bacterium]